MRTKQVIWGLNNSQRIRVILNGIGFYTTVKGATELPFISQNTAMYSALMKLAHGKDNATGIGTRVTVYNHKMEREEFDVQVDLV
jgi:hypothetical protein